MNDPKVKKQWMEIWRTGIRPLAGPPEATGFRFAGTTRFGKQVSEGGRADFINARARPYSTPADSPRTTVMEKIGVTGVFNRSGGWSSPDRYPVPQHR
jgi:hypothetical protein